MLREIRILIRSVILEGKVEDIALKYPEIDVEELAEGDPSPTKKYLSWMVKQASLGANPNDLIPTIQYFHSNTPKFTKKDINTYRSLRELEDEVKAASEKITKTQQKKQVKQGGSDTLYEDDEVIVKHIKEKDACQTYGAGTKWCITMRDHSYWEQYVGANVVFYFVLRKVLKNDPLDKVAVAVQRDGNNNISKIEVFDARDKEIGIEPLKQDILELIEQHTPTVPKGLLVKIKERSATLKEIESALDIYWEDENTMNFIVDNLGKDTPEQMWWRVMSHESSKVRVAVAKSKYVPSDVLAQLARDENYNVRCSVAENPSTPIEVLVQLARDEDRDVRLRVTENPSTPPEILTLLSKDRHGNVRWRVAGNPSTPPELLTLLSRDRHGNVRQLVALNPSTPPEVLVQLARDRHGDVRWRVAENPSTPPEVLVQLARDRHGDVRWRVAENPSTPPEVLVQLSRDEDWSVRWRVAENPSTPTKSLVELAKDVDPTVKMVAKESLAKRQMK